MEKDRVSKENPNKKKKSGEIYLIWEEYYKDSFQDYKIERKRKLHVKLCISTHVSDE